jgi:DNA-binding NarL/FixJ family response regulator
MPMMDGIQAIRETKARWSDVRIAILTPYVYDEYVVEGLMAGADGNLLKDASSAALVSGVVAVAGGPQVMEPSVARHVTELLSKQRAERRQQYDGLTTRELQMLAMIARGLVAKEIGHELRISEKTVHSHVSCKLGVFDRSQVVVYAINNGLVNAE